MGGIADYSGSLVLQRPIAETTTVMLQRRDEPAIAIESSGGRSIVVPLHVLAPDGEPIDYAAARALFPHGSDRHWAAYVAGLFLVLMRERAASFTSGARIVIDSRVPEGKGVSSSASLETAAMAAIAHAFDVPLTPEDLALRCQQAENLVAGAPCGVMDQMACVFGRPDALLALLCQPAQLLAPVTIPDDIAFWGLDSGQRHYVGGSDYTAVRTGAFMGLRIIAARWGRESRADTDCADYLATITPAQFERDFSRHLPEEMSGAAFLALYGETIDPVTRVDPARIYRVRQPAAHPVYEHDRITWFRELLEAPASETRRREAGALLYESHASYSACGLGSPATDRLVALVRSEGRASGLYGARITGGGSGGTVVVLGRPDAGPAIARVVEAYAAQAGHRPYVFSGSSPGVASCGAVDVTI
jgi:L-arabinokinase